MLELQTTSILQFNKSSVKSHFFVFCPIIIIIIIIIIITTTTTTTTTTTVLVFQCPWPAEQCLTKRLHSQFRRLNEFPPPP